MFIFTDLLKRLCDRFLSYISVSLSAHLRSNISNYALPCAFVTISKKHQIAITIPQADPPKCFYANTAETVRGALIAFYRSRMICLVAALPFLVLVALMASPGKVELH